jgi:hypothetical protein
MYVKVPKLVSSTMTGITLQIADRHGRSIGHNNNIQNRTTTYIPCQAYLTHGDPIRYQQGNKTSSFLFATIHDPVHRAISDVFYRRSNQLKAPFEENEILQTLRKGDFLEAKR